MKKIFKSIVISTVACSALLYSTELYEKDINQENYFVSIATGSSSINIKSNLRSNVILYDGALDNQGLVFDLSLGYRAAPNTFFTLGYQNTNLDLLGISHFYTSANYQLSDTKLHPYIGLVLGYGALTWSSDPAIVNYNKKLTEDSTTYGVQIGLEENITDKVSFFARYQMMISDFNLEMYKNTSNINHTQLNNIMIGVNYAF